MSDGPSSGYERISATEVIAALSLATDLSIGFDFEHGLRSTLVAVRLAERLDVDRETASRERQVVSAHGLPPGAAGGPVAALQGGERVRESVPQ